MSTSAVRRKRREHLGVQLVEEVEQQLGAREHRLGLRVRRASASALVLALARVDDQPVRQARPHRAAPPARRPRWRPLPRIPRRRQPFEPPDLAAVGPQPVTYCRNAEKCPPPCGYWSTSKADRTTVRSHPPHSSSPRGHRRQLRRSRSAGCRAPAPARGSPGRTASAARPRARSDTRTRSRRPYSRDGTRARSRPARPRRRASRCSVSTLTCSRCVSSSHCP